MKKIFFVCLIAVFVCCAVRAEGGTFTQGKPNGRFWTALGRNDKTLVILGILSGIAAFDISTETPELDREIRKAVYDTKTILLPKQTVEAVIDRVDEFYAPGANHNIPISDAYVFVCSDFYAVSFGAADWGGERYIEELRDKYGR